MGFKSSKRVESIRARIRSMKDYRACVRDLVQHLIVLHDSFQSSLPNAYE